MSYDEMMKELVEVIKSASPRETKLRWTLQILEKFVDDEHVSDLLEDII
jgi:hypothetical protein